MHAEEKWVRVRTFSMSAKHEAVMAKGMLEANGIRARVGSDQGSSSRWDVHLFVRSQDFEIALKLLPN